MWDYDKKEQWDGRSMIAHWEDGKALYPIYGRIRYNPRYDKVLDIGPPRVDPEIVRDQLIALSSHESGHGLGYDGHSPFEGHVMYGANSSLVPPSHITDFELRINATQTGLKNLTDMARYSRD